MRVIDLRDNKLTGMLDPNVKNYSLLKKLYLSNNLFEGNLPSELSSLTTIQRIYINGNNFTGTISEVMDILKPINTKCVRMADNWWSCPLESWNGVAPENDYSDNGSQACWCALSEWSEWSKAYPSYGEGSVMVKKSSRNVIAKQQNGGYCFILEKVQLSV